MFMLGELVMTYSHVNNAKLSCKMEWGTMTIRKTQSLIFIALVLNKQNINDCN